MEQQLAFLNFTLRLGDSSLILGQRLSELCGHGPILEEDIALTNIALDFIGQASALYTFAGKLEGKNRTEDDFTFFRDERAFKNALLVEQPNGDFAHTMVRQYFFDVFQLHLFEALHDSKEENIAGFARKFLKEVVYHVRHSSQWLLRLGDGTEESHQRVQSAVDSLWMFTGDLFESTAEDKLLTSIGINIDFKVIQSKWLTDITALLTKATLVVPSGAYMQTGSREGKHTEYLGFLLAEMQYLPRSLPTAKW